MPKPVVPFEPPEGGRASIAWPHLKMALCVEGDDSRPFEKAGWTVFTLSTQLLTALPPFLQIINDLAYEKLLRQSEQDLSNRVSSHEKVMLRALMEVGLPQPRRDFSFDVGGQLVSVPDFAWFETKLILEIDGLFHHGGRELREEILAGAADDKEKAALLKARSEQRQTKDASKRRLLSADGWLVMVATDSEIDRGEAERIALEVKAAFNKRLAEFGGALPVPANVKNVGRLPIVEDDAIAAPPRPVTPTQETEPPVSEEPSPEPSEPPPPTAPVTSPVPQLEPVVFEDEPLPAPAPPQAPPTAPSVQEPPPPPFLNEPEQNEEPIFEVPALPEAEPPSNDDEVPEWARDDAPLF